MPMLPERASPAQLRKQAKELLAAYRAGEPEAMLRFQRSLPAARGLSPADIAARHYRLHDAQSCLAREYGFVSWLDLKTWVESAGQARALPLAQLQEAWLALVYGRGHTAPQPGTAARLLAARPELERGSLSFTLALGNRARIEVALAQDPELLERPIEPFSMPPLVAVTHSSLVRLPEHAIQVLDAAELLLDRGADPNGAYSDSQFPGSRLSALYGAAGKNHHLELTRLLLARGADPNHGESLYHSLESNDLSCARLLLDHGGDPNGPGDWPPLHWAIRRGRSLAHVTALLDAGADPAATGPDGRSAYRTALTYGAVDVADRLREVTGEPEPGPVDQFIAAAARGDFDAGRGRPARAAGPGGPAERRRAGLAA